MYWLPMRLIGTKLIWLFQKCWKNTFSDQKLLKADAVREFQAIIFTIGLCIFCLAVCRECSHETWEWSMLTDSMRSSCWSSYKTGGSFLWGTRSGETSGSLFSAWCLQLCPIRIRCSKWTGARSRSTKAFWWSNSRITTAPWSTIGLLFLCSRAALLLVLIETSGPH